MSASRTPLDLDEALEEAYVTSAHRYACLLVEKAARRIAGMFEGAETVLFDLVDISPDGWSADVLLVSTADGTVLWDIERDEAEVEIESDVTDPLVVAVTSWGRDSHELFPRTSAPEFRSVRTDSGFDPAVLTISEVIRRGEAIREEMTY